MKISIRKFESKDIPNTYTQDLFENNFIKIKEQEEC